MSDLLTEKKNKIIFKLISVVIIFIFSISSMSCASIVHGSRQQVRLSSEPSGAEVEIFGGAYHEKRKTPCTLDVKSNSTYNMIFSKKGYKDANRSTSSSLSGWFWVGAIFVPFSLIIDLISGSAYRLSPDNVAVVLMKTEDSNNWREDSIEPSTAIDGLNIDITLPARNSPRISIALTGLRHRGITEEEAAIITDILRRKLFQTDYFQVTDKATMEIVLEQQNFQMSDCSDHACSIEIGRLLDVAKVAFGSVSKLGSKYILEIAVADVETGELIAAEGCELICEIEEIPNLAGCAAGKIALHFAPKKE